MNYLESIEQYVTKTANLSSDPLEIELKIIIDPRVRAPSFARRQYVQNIRTCIDRMSEGSSQTQTINFIHTTSQCDTARPKMMVKQLVYNGTTQNKGKKNYYSKVSLVDPIYLIDDHLPAYKFAVNVESTIEPFDKPFDVVRFRSRQSRRVGQWRIDITYVKECRTYTMSMLKIIRDALFTSGVDRWKASDKVEVEFEYIGASFALTAIKEVDDYLTPIFATVANLKVANLATPAETTTILYKRCLMEAAAIMRPNQLKKFNHGYGLKQLGSNPIELTQLMYARDVLPKITQYIITEKIDGIRSLVMLYPSAGLCHIINNKTKVGVNTITIPHGKSRLIILDAEAIVRDTDQSSDIYYVFDLIYEDNTDDAPKQWHQSGFDARRVRMSEIIEQYTFLRSKHYVELNDTYGTQISAFYEAMSNPDQKKYEIDGLIFFTNDSKMRQYKWKPVMTVDFVLRACPECMMGVSPYNNKPGKTLYLLFCGIRKLDFVRNNIPILKGYKELFDNAEKTQQYFPIQFTPSEDPMAYLFWHENGSLDGSVVELRWRGDEWIFVKERHDRAADLNRKTYYGNYIKYAELIWMTYKAPLTLNALSAVADTSYFRSGNRRAYANVRKFNNFVKNEIIINYGQPHKQTNNRNPPYVIDLCCGRGQDLDKYIAAGFRHVYMIDSDRNALLEVVNRKYGNVRQNKSINIALDHIDLTQSSKKVLDRIKTKRPGLPAKASLIVCNFALHYLIPTPRRTMAIANIIKALLAPGGMFIFTAFDGQKVFDLLADGPWTRDDGKYSIKKKSTSQCSGTTFTGNKQQIDVVLPFTGGHHYTEYLINIAVVTAAMAKHNITHIVSGSFLDYLPTNKTGFVDRMSPTDREFAGLYAYHVYQRL
jgi:hypothetical protein